MNNFRSGDTVPPTYQRASRVGSPVEYNSPSRGGSHDPLRTNRQGTSTCVGKHGPAPFCAGRSRINRSQSKFTNPGRILTLLAAISLAACGGGAKSTHLSSDDISDSILELASAADTVIHVGITSRNANQWQLGGTSFSNGFQADIIFSRSLEYLDTEAGVRRAEAVFQTSPEPVVGSLTQTTQTDYRDYAGWMDYSMFYVRNNHNILEDLVTGESMIDDQSWGVATWSIGKASDSRPVSGGASWNGIMVGVDVSMSDTIGQRVEGSAELDIPDFSLPAIDVSFTDIAYTSTGNARPSIDWSGLPIDDSGVFGGSGIQGRFYGPNHEEVGSVFLREMISGSFGASR